MNNTDITNTYRLIREKNDTIRNAKIADIHAKYPDIKEIDEAIRKLNMELTMLFFDKEKDVNSETDRISSERETLKKRKSLLLKDHNIDINYDGKIYSCPTCKDKGYVDGNKCLCYFNNIKNTLYSNSSIHHVFEKENFRNFNYNLYSDNMEDADDYAKPYKTQRNYMKEVVRISKKLVDDDLKKSLYFFGTTGVGKTFLCSSITKYAIDNLKSVEYHSANSLFDIIAKYKMKKDADTYEEAKNTYNKIMHCDILIIDDLGTEYINDFVIAELFTILNQRLIAGKKFVISSNISPGKLEEKYGDRISSRILGNFYPLKISGKDLRLYK